MKRAKYGRRPHAARVHLRPGNPERRTHDYRCNGTTSLFATLDVATGKCCRSHRSKGFPDFPKEIDARIPKEPDLHIVMDNHAARRIVAVRVWSAMRPALACPFHAALCFPDQSGRAPVRRTDTETIAAGRPRLLRAARSGYLCLHRKAQPGSETLQVDEIRRRHPQCRQTLPSPGQS